MKRNNKKIIDVTNCKNLIFTRQDGAVRLCSFHVDEVRLKEIQSEIDNSSRRGELKSAVATFIQSNEIGYKIDIVSKVYVGKGEVFSYCCPGWEEADMYGFKYYEYKMQPLSKLCDELLNTCGVLKLSRLVSKALNWDVKSLKELETLNKIICCFEYEILDYPMALDIESKSIISKCKKTLFGKPSSTVTVREYYMSKVEEEIKSMEAVNSGFYGRDLNGREFKFNFIQAGSIKTKIFNELPNYNKTYKKCTLN